MDVFANRCRLLIMWVIKPRLCFIISKALILLFWSSCYLLYFIEVIHALELASFPDVIALIIAHFLNIYE
jgi:hypothetical protein